MCDKLDNVYQCCSNKLHCFQSKFLTVSECLNLIKKCNCCSLKSQILWKTACLIGYLFPSDSGVWALSDCRGIMNCLLVTNNNQDLFKLAHKIVAIHQFGFVLEEIKVNKNQFGTGNSLSYLLLFVDDVNVLYDPKILTQSFCKMKNKEINKISFSSTSALLPTKQTNCLMKTMLKTIYKSHCQSEMSYGQFCYLKKAPNKIELNCNSKIRFNQNEISPTKYSNSYALKTAQRIVLKIQIIHKSLIVDTSQYGSECHILLKPLEQKCLLSLQNQYILTLRGPLLKFAPLLFPGFSYILSLSSFPKIFYKSQVLSAIKHALVIEVPYDSVLMFCYLQYPAESPRNLMENICSLRGIIYERYFIRKNLMSNPRTHDLENPCWKFDSVTLVLKLDLPDHRVTVYFSEGTKYPFGLLPGCTIYLHFVKRKCSVTDNFYYHTVPFTSISILELPLKRTVYLSQTHLDQLDVWGFWSDISQSKALQIGSLLYSNISELTVVKIVIEAKCMNCESIIIDNSCSGETCFSPVISAHAVCLVETVLGQSVIFIKDANVQVLLDLTDAMWKNLAILACKSKLLYSRSLDKTPNCLTLAQSIFEEYCKIVPFTHFHICCRKLPGQESRLFCVALKRSSQETSRKMFAPLIDKL